MRSSAWIAAWTAAAVMGPLGCGGKIPLPKNLEVAGAPELAAKMNAARSPVKGFLAEARMTYFGAGNRVKGSANLAVARPSSLRYDLMGPGGVVEAFATNGRELQLLMPGQGRFLYGPASVPNIDRLMSFAPLRLDPKGWVGLLFGEIDVPPDAALRYDDVAGQFVLTWANGASQVEVWVDPPASRVTRAVVRQGPAVLSDVEVKSRDTRGLPSSLRMKAPAADIDVRVVLRDVEYDPESLDESAFVLQPARGMTPEYLGP